MKTSADFENLHVSLGVILKGPVNELQRVLHGLESLPAVRVVYVRTSGGRLRVVEDEGRP